MPSRILLRRQKARDILKLQNNRTGSIREEKKRDYKGKVLQLTKVAKRATSIAG